MKKRIFVCLILLGIFMAFFFAYNNSTESIERVKDVPITIVSDANIEAGGVTPFAEKKNVQYYVVNQETKEKEPVSILLPQKTKLSPQLLLEFVVDSMEEQSFLIEIDSVKTEGDTIIVCFSDQTEFLSETDKAVENEILDAIAQSLLDNLKDYSKVIYRVFEEGYQSVNKSFSKDYVYMEKKK